MDYSFYINSLKEHTESSFKEFHSTLAKSSIEVLGVKMKHVRDLAKQILNDDWRTFIRNGKSDYLEELTLQGIVVAQAKYKDYDELLEYFGLYLPKIESWATCDSLCCSFKSIKKYKSEFITRIDSLIKSENEWHVRVGFVMLLCYYVETDYLDTIFDYTSKYDSSENYYVSMSVAWLLSVVCVKFPDQCTSYLKTHKISENTFKRTIRKIKDSYRIKLSEADIHSIQQS